VCPPFTPFYCLEKYIIPFLDSLEFKGKIFNAKFEVFNDKKKSPTCRATMNQHPPAHHPLDARYFSVVDETQLR
jgi:hypothetical protein